MAPPEDEESETENVSEDSENRSRGSRQRRSNRRKKKGSRPRERSASRSPTGRQAAGGAPGESSVLLTLLDRLSRFSDAEPSSRDTVSPTDAVVAYVGSTDRVDPHEAGDRKILIPLLARLKELRQKTKTSEPWLSYAFIYFPHLVLKKIHTPLTLRNLPFQLKRLREKKVILYAVTQSSLSEADVPPPQARALEPATYGAVFESWCDRMLGVLDRCRSRMYLPEFDPVLEVAAAVDRRFDLLFDHEFVQEALAAIAHGFNYLVPYNLFNSRLIAFAETPDGRLKPFDRVLLAMALFEEYQRDDAPRREFFSREARTLFEAGLETARASLIDNVRGNAQLSLGIEEKRLARSVLTGRPVDLSPQDVAVSWRFDTSLDGLMKGVSPELYAFSVSSIVAWYHTREPVPEAMAGQMRFFLDALDDTLTKATLPRPEEPPSVFRWLFATFLERGFTRYYCERYVGAMRLSERPLNPGGLTDDVLQRVAYLAYLGLLCYRLFEDYSLSRRYLPVYQRVRDEVLRDEAFFESLGGLKPQSALAFLRVFRPPAGAEERLQASLDEHVRALTYVDAEHPTVANETAARAFDLLYRRAAEQGWDVHLKSTVLETPLTADVPKNIFDTATLGRAVAGLDFAGDGPALSEADRLVLADPSFADFYLAGPVARLLQRTFRASFGSERGRRDLAARYFRAGLFGAGSMGGDQSFRATINGLAAAVEPRGDDPTLEESGALAKLLSEAETFVRRASSRLTEAALKSAGAPGAEGTGGFVSRFVTEAQSLSYRRAYREASARAENGYNSALGFAKNCVSEIDVLKNFCYASVYVSGRGETSFTAGDREIGTWPLDRVFDQLGLAVKRCEISLRRLSDARAILSREVSAVTALRENLAENLRMEYPERIRTAFEAALSKMTSLGDRTTAFISNVTAFIERARDVALPEAVFLVEKVGPLAATFEGQARIDSPDQLVRLFSLSDHVLGRAADAVKIPPAKQLGRRSRVEHAVIKVLCPESNKENCAPDEDELIDDAPLFRFSGKSDLLDWNDFDQAPLWHAAQDEERPRRGSELPRLLDLDALLAAVDQANEEETR